MSFQEKRNIVYLMCSLVTYGGFFGVVLHLHQAGRLESTNWGVAILLLVPFHIVVNVVLEVVFTVINIVVTQEEGPSFTDEFDKSIELRATRNAFYVFSGGFLVAMGAVALDQPMYVMFNLQVLAFFLSEIAWGITHLYFYRSGL